MVKQTDRQEGAQRRILLHVAYDGTAYAGFQAQKSGIATVEGTLQQAVQALTGEETLLIGGSRTDAGVHAMDNVVVFNTHSRIPGEKVAYALNVRLPEDIRVQASAEVVPDFHPRHCTVEKTYEYRIYNAPLPSPLYRLYSYYSYTAFDVDRMNRAAKSLVGTHDFKSFCSIYSQAATTVRTITGAEVVERPVNGSRSGKRAGTADDAGAPVAGMTDTGEMTTAAGKPAAAGLTAAREIIIRISGHGFLYNMVRIIAGTLMEIGRGAREEASIPAILDACDRRAAGPTAPPEGLTLVKYAFVEPTEKEILL